MSAPLLKLGKRVGRLPFSHADVRTLHAFAGQAALALELAEARRDAERLGGSFHAAARPQGGTHLEWSVPLT
ncbi:hypothetical protein [Planomonospora algeriensis]